MSLPVSSKVAGDLSTGPDSIIVECTAGEAITAGQVVMDDVAITDIALVGKQVKIGTGRIQGVAINSAASGGIVRVLKRGFVTGIKTDGSVVVATPMLAPDGTDAVKTATASTIQTVGFALADDSSTTSGLCYIDCL